jgi:hypothetical protein
MESLIIRRNMNISFRAFAIKELNHNLKEYYGTLVGSAKVNSAE